MYTLRRKILRLHPLAMILKHFACPEVEVRIGQAVSYWHLAHLQPREHHSELYTHILRLTPIIPYVANAQRHCFIKRGEPKNLYR